jgi:hypothetical protein
MATGVKSWSTTASDNDDADTAINWLEGQAPSTVNDSARAMMAAIADWYAQIKAGTIIGTVGGTADAITLTCSPTVTAYAAGQRFLFKAPGTNTTIVTLAVDGLAATAVRYKDVALVAGDIVTGDYMLVTYDGTRFQMVNPPRLSWATTDVPTDSTGGATGDLFLFADASESNALNKVTVQSLFNNVMTNLTAETAPDVADSLLLYDASEAASNTTTITNFFKTMNGLTAKSTPTTSDVVPIIDAAASNVAKNCTIGNIQSILKAVQATQETGTSTALFVTPGVQQYHQSAAKIWANVSAAGVDNGSYNVTSTADTATCRWTITIATDFSTAVWSCLVTPEATQSRMANSRSLAAGTVEINSFLGDGTTNELGLTATEMAGFGVQ